MRKINCADGLPWNASFDKKKDSQFYPCRFVAQARPRHMIILLKLSYESNYETTFCAVRVKEPGTACVRKV